MARDRTGHIIPHDSPKEVRRAEIRRLRQLSAEAAGRGDWAEARKLDRLADDHAQELLFPVSKRKEPEQLDLFEVE